MRREKLSSGAVCCAGLTIEDGWYKYLLLEKKADGELSVAGAISLEVGCAGSNLYEELFCLLDANSAPKEIPIVFALRFNESLIKIIDMQRFSLEEARSALRYQFEDYFPFALKESNYQVQEIDFPTLNNKLEKRFVAAACRTCLINEIRAGAEKSGYRLSCVEPSQISFERAAAPDGLRESLIQIYAGKSDLMFIFSYGKNGIFYRNAVIRADGVEYVDRATVEAKISLDFALSHIVGLKAERTIVAGPNASDVFCDILVQSLRCGLPESISLPSGYYSACGQLPDAGMILPFGAAMRQL